jgi:hypothetical protein
VPARFGSDAHVDLSRGFVKAHDAMLKGSASNPSRYDYMTLGELAARLTDYARPEEIVRQWGMIIASSGERDAPHPLPQAAPQASAQAEASPPCRSMDEPQDLEMDN